jgi:hypothetical protein
MKAKLKKLENALNLALDKLAALEEQQPSKKKQSVDLVTAKLVAKEVATARKEPWVDVIKTHINTTNANNGFFELDWNEYFIIQLKKEGYGVDGDTEEGIIDRWFRDLARNIFSDEGMDATRQAGFVDLANLEKLKNSHT